MTLGMKQAQQVESTQPKTKRRYTGSGHVVSSNLRRLRQAYQLTQQQLAASAHVSARAIADIETTCGPWRTDTIERLADALGVSPAEFWRPLAQLPDCERPFWTRHERLERDAQGWK